MEDDFEEMENLMDDDPALDHIMYENMTQGDNKKQGGNGCLGVIILLLLPFVTVSSFGLGLMFCNSGTIPQ